MAKKTNTSPDTTSSRAKAPSVAPKKESGVSNHRRAKSNTSEAAAVASAPATVERPSEPVSQVVSSHHSEVTTGPEAPRFNITHEDIATLAFSYWEHRGYQGGSPEEDWRRAEEELQSLLK